ncbi:MAG: ATP-binding cassette domain-containing protein [Deltaproteobacteria bacterium]|nr:ATP-binding cassette domain-containing protein [Deltaproteobacteria bacterium]
METRASRKKKSVIGFFNVCKFYGESDAIVDVSFTISKDDFALITGPSGAGKSTVIRIIYMGETISSGSVIVDGMNLLRITRPQVPLLRRKIGVIFQDFKLIPSKTVFGNVALVLEAAGVRSKNIIHDKVMSVLETVGIGDRAASYPPTLSGGEQQRVAVARAMVGEPKIILADEPTASLDPEAADAIYQLLQDVHARGTTVVVTTHDLNLLEKGGTRVIHLKSGRMVSIVNQDVWNGL